MVLKEMKVGGWKFFVSPEAEIFPRAAIKKIKNLLSRWVDIFPREGTWVERIHGVPSLLVRIDCVISNYGDLHVYEVEDCPTGVGIASQINPQFRERLEDLLKIWPPFDVVISRWRAAQGIKGDDLLWKRVLTYEETYEKALRNEGLFLVRAWPWDVDFHIFSPCSVAPIKHKGLKNYGEALGLWRKVSSPEELPWEEGFVLKRLQGSDMDDVEIWHPSLRNRVKGVSTRTRIKETLLRCGKMYLQKFYPPMMRNIMGKIFYTIYWVYFGYNPAERRYVCLGGLWNGRPNQLRIHGAPDAVFGPLVLE